MKADVDMEVRHQASRAIGFGGLTKDIAAQLSDKMKDVNLKSDAALALLIGGDTDDASRAIANYGDSPPEAMEELKVVYNQTFGYWSDKNYENGDVARWIANAEACRHVKVHDALQDWPDLVLSRAIQGILLGTQDLAELRVADCGIGVAEPGSIEGIKRVAPELDIPALAEREAFEYAKVLRRIVRASQVSEVARRVAQR